MRNVLKHSQRDRYTFYSLFFLTDTHTFTSARARVERIEKQRTIVFGALRRYLQIFAFDGLTFPSLLPLHFHFSLHLQECR